MNVENLEKRLLAAQGMLKNAENILSNLILEITWLGAPAVSTLKIFEVIADIDTAIARLKEEAGQS